jgi:hypothetical protein
VYVYWRAHHSLISAGVMSEKLCVSTDAVLTKDSIQDCIDNPTGPGVRWDVELEESSESDDYAVFQYCRAGEDSDPWISVSGGSVEERQAHSITDGYSHPDKVVYGEGYCGGTTGAPVRACACFVHKTVAQSTAIRCLNTRCKTLLRCSICRIENHPCLRPSQWSLTSSEVGKLTLRLRLLSQHIGMTRPSTADPMCG